MSPQHFGTLNRTRTRILASAAVVSLIAAGAIGEGALTAPHSASAAPVVTGDLPGPSMPSFASLITRVKPAADRLARRLRRPRTARS